MNTNGLVKSSFYDSTHDKSIWIHFLFNSFVILFEISFNYDIFIEFINKRNDGIKKSCRNRIPVKNHTCNGKYICKRETDKEAFHHFFNDLLIP